MAITTTISDKAGERSVTMSSAKKLVMLLGTSNTPRYIFRDDFSDDRAAGEINDTLTTDGLKTRKVVDGGSLVTITGGKIVKGEGAGAWYDPFYYVSSDARKAGNIYFFNIVPGEASKNVFVGLFPNLIDGSKIQGFKFGSDNVLRLQFKDGENIAIPVITTWGALTEYDLAIMVLSTGYLYFIRRQNRFELLEAREIGTTTPLYAAINYYENSSAIDFVHGVSARVIKPKLSDGFSVSGITDGLGHGYGGGGGYTWVNWRGTWGAADGVATPLTLDENDEAVAAINIGNRDIYLTCTLVPSSGKIGIILRGANSDNYIMVYWDTGDSKLHIWQRRTGTITNELYLSGVLTFGAGKLTVSISHVDAGYSLIRMSLNDVPVWIEGQPIYYGEFQTGANIGLYSDNLENTLDNLVVYALGREEDYLWFDGFSENDRTWLASEKFIISEGDSHVSGGGLAASDFPTSVLTSLGSPYTGANVGIGGTQIEAAITRASANVDSRYNSTRLDNVCCFFDGSNDMAGAFTAQQVYDNLKIYWAARRAIGWKVVAFTLLPRGEDADVETKRQAINTLIKSDSTLYDALVDLGADATIGEAGDQNNLTYYGADKTHLTTDGYAVLIPLVVTAIQSLYP